MTRRLVRLKYVQRTPRPAVRSLLVGMVSFLDFHGVNSFTRNADLVGCPDLDIPDRDALAGDIDAIYEDFTVAADREHALDEVTVG